MMDRDNAPGVSLGASLWFVLRAGPTLGLPLVFVLVLACGVQSSPAHTHEPASVLVAPTSPASALAPTPADAIGRLGEPADPVPAPTSQPAPQPTPATPTVSLPGYLASQQPAALWSRMRPWFEGKTHLVGRDCRPVPFLWAADGTLTVTRRRPRLEGKTKIVEIRQTTLGPRLIQDCGGEEVFVRRHGVWERSGVNAFGCSHPTDFRLNGVADGAAWYTGLRVQLSLRCARSEQTLFKCGGQTLKTCHRCGEWRVDRRYLDSHGGVSPGVGGMRAMITSCAPPACPQDAPKGPFALLESVPNDTVYITAPDFSAAPPTVFRDRASCVSYRQKHPTMRAAMGQPVW